jgi:hypothetical protein
MARANFKDEYAHQFHAIPRTEQRSRKSRERISDVWPDFSTELGDDRIEKQAEKNKPSIVLWEAVRAVMVSVGMVSGLMVVLDLLGVR